MKVSLETLKLYKMYLERKKQEYKHDYKKTAEENLAKYVYIGLALDNVDTVIKHREESQS